MENAVKSFLKQKRKHITTKFITSKKCKHYHKSQLIRNQQPLEQHLSTDSSDTENLDTSETNSEAKTVLFPQNINPFNSYYYIAGGIKRKMYLVHYQDKEQHNSNLS